MWTPPAGHLRPGDAGLDVLRKHGVDWNILRTVNAANEHQGRAVYRFFRDELKATWIQFIPIVERGTPETIDEADRAGASARPQRPLYIQDGNLVTERTVGGEQYGRFLVDVFEEWVAVTSARCSSSCST